MYNRRHIDKKKKNIRKRSIVQVKYVQQLFNEQYVAIVTH